MQKQKRNNMDLNENYLKGLINGSVGYHLISGGTTEQRLKDLNLSWHFENVGKDKKVICKFICALSEVHHAASTDRGLEEYTELEPIFDTDWFIVSEHDTYLKFGSYMYELLERLDNIKLNY